MTDLAKLVVKLEAQNAQFMSQLEAANKKLDKFAKAAKTSAANIAAGVATGAAAAAAAFAAMASNTLENGDKLAKMSQSTGVAVETLSRLGYAADLSGVSLDDLGKASAKLSKTMADAARGGKMQQEAFNKLGISVKNTDGTLRSSEDVMLDIADKFADMEDGATKSALAMEYFGKSGVSMIPFLNMGRDGIKELTDEADALGVTISTQTAKQAEMFNDNLSRLKGAAQGLVNVFVERALPMLVALTDRFVKGAKEGGAFNAAVGVMAVTFKSLVSAGIVVKSVLQTVGRLLYGVGAALVSLVKGDFKIAADEMRDAFRESVLNVSDDIGLIAEVWSDAAPEMADAAKDLEKPLKDTIVFNDEKAGEAARKATESAIDALKSMAVNLKQQADTFKMTDAAAIQYRLTQGDLADKVRQAGAAGEEYVRVIIAETARLEKLEKQQKKTADAQEAWNKSVSDAKSLIEATKTPQEKYADQIKRINDLITDGLLTQTQYERAVKAAQDTLVEATKVQNKFLEEANKNVQNILGQGITDIIRGEFEDGLDGMLDSFISMLDQMAAQALAANLAAKIFGGEGMGSGGGWLGSAMNFAKGIFGGSRDSGGSGKPGTAYLIGKGAQPELFVPDRPGQFIPANQWMGGGGGGVTQNIYVQGKVDERTARQLELDTARRQRHAMRLA